MRKNTFTVLQGGTAHLALLIIIINYYTLVIITIADYRKK